MSKTYDKKLEDRYHALRVRFNDILKERFNCMGKSRQVDSILWLMAERDLEKNLEKESEEE